MRRSIHLLIALFVAFTGLVTRTASAWNDCGHMMVACIAYKALPATTQAELITTLRGNETLYAMLIKGLPADATPEQKDLYTFMRAATWPDMIRGDRVPMHDQNRPHWHYINFPLAFDGKEHEEPPTAWTVGEEPGNILQAIAKCEADLKDTNLPKEERAIRLCWLLHLCGDIHQPLHSAAMYSAHYPKGDEGGNRIVVIEENKKTKLHSLWDGLAGNSREAPAAVYAAEQLLKKQTVSRKTLEKQIAEASALKWAEESRAIAKQVAYRDGKFPPENAEASQQEPLQLPAFYLAKAHEAAEVRIALAGYRLEEKLKELFAAKE